ncbi:MAG: HAMP domain-containing protein [Vicinamibacteraceae bacterium]|nr:HAMP domain-containing protein [Vicinamibacteraceae bacterium]
MPAVDRGSPPPPLPVPDPARRPLRDNPRLILVWIVLLVVGLVAIVRLADRSAEFAPDFLSEVVLYALTLADLTILVALGFVLARNIIKLVVERRRGLPFARFRSKLVAVLLGMTIIPALLVLFVGSELIRNSASRWFSAPIDEVLTSASAIASDYYQERQSAARRQARALAADLGGLDLGAAGVAAVRARILRVVNERQASLVEVYRLEPPGTTPRAVPVVDVAAPTLPRVGTRAVADRLAEQAAAGQPDVRQVEPLRDGGELVRVAEVVREGGGRATGVVVVSDYLAGALARNSRRVVDAYESYQQLRVLRRPLEGVYLSFFLMVTLLILVSATWMGLYLAKRIVRPIQALAAGAREIGAGHLDHRIEPETRDEFGGLVEAFNSMAAELAASQRRLERSRVDLERTNLEVETRRQYIETILERIATGVISIASDGRVSTVNGAAQRLLGLDDTASGRDVAEVLGRADLAPLAAVVDRGMRGAGAHAGGQEVALSLDGRDVHLAVATTPLPGGDGPAGSVVVLDDVTPLIRAQKVAAWRDVARRLAHEVKNPLTPIQLCAERLRSRFAQAPEPQRQLVQECADTIVQEVESLKLLVDEFSQFARMPAPRTAPSDLNALIADALALYRGLFARVRIEPRLAPALPPVRVDPEQFRRVVINLIDNAIEAFGEGPDGPQGGLVAVATEHDVANGVVRVTVSDDGPGLAEEDQARVFMPYYSTKKRGSGLGLAIVRRIVVEHGGSIEATGNLPRGTRMIIELPA